MPNWVFNRLELRVTEDFDKNLLLDVEEGGFTLEKLIPTPKYLLAEDRVDELIEWRKKHWGVKDFITEKPMEVRDKWIIFPLILTGWDTFIIGVKRIYEDNPDILEINLLYSSMESEFAGRYHIEETGENSCFESHKTFPYGSEEDYFSEEEVNKKRYRLLLQWYREAHVEVEAGSEYSAMDYALGFSETLLYNVKKTDLMDTLQIVDVEEVK